jgi:uncharacterized protein
VKSISEGKVQHLRQLLLTLKSCAIAYSGGVDSTFLCKIAYDVLGDKALAVTATSSLFPEREFKDARQFAQEIGIHQIIIHSEELTIPLFSDNPPDRCYYCKKEYRSPNNTISTPCWMDQTQMTPLIIDQGHER